MKILNDIINQDESVSIFDFVTNTQDGKYSENNVPTQCRIEYEDYLLVQNEANYDDGMLFMGLSY